MSSTEINFDLRELDNITKLLKKAKLSYEDRIHLLKKIGVEVEEQTRERISETKESPSIMLLNKKWV